MFGMPNFLVRRITTRMFSAVVAFVALVALISCATSRASLSGTPVAAQADPRPLVLTTFTVTADMARAVAGEHLRVESITAPGAEIHGYDPTPQDVAHAAHAALVLDNGLGLEAWLEQFTRDSGAPHVTLTRGITPLSITSGEAAGHADPHAWMSPRLGRVYVANIVDAFVELDPAHATDYRARGQAYQHRLEAIAVETERALSTIPPARRGLVTCEGAFGYLARDVGLTAHFLWPINADSEATPRRTGAVIDTVRGHEIPALFCESTVNDRVAREVADETGARFGGTLYVDSLSRDDGPVPTYLDLLRHDTRTITSALTSSATSGRTP